MAWRGGDGAVASCSKVVVELCYGSTRSSWSCGAAWQSKMVWCSRDRRWHGGGEERRWRADGGQKTEREFTRFELITPLV
ncbi:hypothetical protein WN944_000272 [Citrus x changshan-huyou]|uniref:Uncharacterized protein n=1 Tax=Citrus x changshan-huyou TaxID=2935761 RepID=A0AAP0ME83_9ROSI